VPHVSWSGTGEGRYVRQFDGGGEYAHVKICISPGPPGSGVRFTDETVPGAIPKRFIAAVEEGVREAARRGTARGFLIQDIRIELVDGSYHDVDSSETAFRFAAAMAFRDAVNNTGTTATDDDDVSRVTEPRHPRPTPRDSAVAVPEPDETPVDDLYRERQRND